MSYAGDVDIESLRGKGSQGEDDAAAKRQGAMLDRDEDFHALRRLLDSVELGGDENFQELRQLVGNDRRRRLHLALDRVLNRMRERRCTGDRARCSGVGQDHFWDDFTKGKTS